MEFSTCCYGSCGPAYHGSPLPFLALLAIIVAGRCAWRSRGHPGSSLSERFVVAATVTEALWRSVAFAAAALA